MTPQFAALLIGSLAAGSVMASTFDLSADFSTTANPNGAWSYGHEITLDSNSFTLLPNVHNDSQAGTETYFWNSAATAACCSDSDTVPFVGKNTGLVNATLFTITLDAGEVALHPGFGADSYSVVRWTAPSADTFSFAAQFRGVDATTTDVHVLLNGGSLFSGSISGFHNFTSYSAALALVAGDVIDFAVGSGGNGISNDATGLSVNISTSPVPLSSPVWLLSAGFGLLSFRIKRKQA